MRADKKRDPRVTNLRAWRLKLQNDRVAAAQIVEMTLGNLRAKGLFHWTELVRFRSQMMNGVHTPGEFGQGEWGVKIA